MHNTNYILTFSCRDQPGIVADVTNFFAEKGFNIRESSQFDDTHTERFFMRSHFEYLKGDFPLNDLRQSFESLAQKYQMDWSLRNKAYKPKVVIAVSRWSHCLDELLNSWQRGALPIDIAAVVSNHQDARELVERYQLEYHYLPVTKESKPQQEKQILELFQTKSADFLVLARYMQILSNDLCEQLSGKAINIHHSFLPGFKGARPYHQAFERGVKLIGATAHFVTSDLDEGPIIEQAVERVSHNNTPESMVEIGRNLEEVVLKRAVLWMAEQRVILNGHKTVVFGR